MIGLTALSHPAWCDPGQCTSSTDAMGPSAMHSSQRRVYHPGQGNSAAAFVAVRLIQNDDVVITDSDPVWAELEVTDPLENYAGTDVMTADLWLDSDDLRAVAALLLRAADELDEVQRA